MFNLFKTTSVDQTNDTITSDQIYQELIEKVSRKDFFINYVFPYLRATFEEAEDGYRDRIHESAVAENWFLSTLMQEWRNVRGRELTVPTVEQLKHLSAGHLLYDDASKKSFHHAIAMFLEENENNHQKNQLKAKFGPYLSLFMAFRVLFIYINGQRMGASKGITGNVAAIARRIGNNTGEVSNRDIKMGFLIVLIAYLAGVVGGSPESRQSFFACLRENDTSRVTDLLSQSYFGRLNEGKNIARAFDFFDENTQGLFHEGGDMTILPPFDDEPVIELSTENYSL